MWVTASFSPACRNHGAHRWHRGNSRPPHEFQNKSTLLMLLSIGSFDSMTRRPRRVGDTTPQQPTVSFDPTASRHPRASGRHCQFNRPTDGPTAFVQRPAHEKTPAALSNSRRRNNLLKQQLQKDQQRSHGASTKLRQHNANRNSLLPTTSSKHTTSLCNREIHCKRNEAKKQ